MNTHKLRTGKMPWLAVFYVVVMVFGFTLNVQAVTLKTVMTKVIERNYDLKQVQSFSQQASQENNYARSQYYPKASLEMSFIRSDDPVFAFGSYLRQERFTSANFNIDSLNRPSPADDFTASVSVGVPIYTAGKLSYGVKTAQTHIAQASQQEIMVRSQLILQVLERYFSAVRDREVSSVAIEIEKLAQSEIKDASNLASRGMAPGADYYGAVAITHGISARRIESESSYENAISALAIMAGEDKNSFVIDAKMSEKEYSVPTLETLINTALQSRNDINIARLQQTALKDAHTIEKKNILPSVQAFGKVQTDAYDVKYMPDHYTIGVQLSMPLLDQSHSSKVNMIEQQYQQSNSKLASMGEQVTIEVTNAYTNYKASVRALNEMRNSYEQAQKSVKMMRVLYRQGRVSVIDMLRAEEQLLSVQTAFFKTVYNMNMAYASLMAVSGQLSLDTVQTINDLIQEAR
ncbi:MAG: TolC family protein [Endomicrobiaceae bacterium]|nr:TolC family protein [Endomicrobiaceae bacterium]